MQRSFLQFVVLTVLLSLSAQAGTISGNVTGVPGTSVVYVEAERGKLSRLPHSNLSWRKDA